MERRKFYTVVCIATFTVLLISNFCFAKYSGGDGTETNPYKIANPNDLIALGNNTEDYNADFIMVNDINLAGYTFDKAVIAPDTNPSSWNFNGTSFTGVFDGNEHSIILLAIEANEPSNCFLGLFGEIGSGGLIKNVGIEDVNITGNWYIGGLCGENYGSVISCYSTGTVSGYSYIGGLCGINNGSIDNSYSTGQVIAPVQGEFYSAGGLCGANSGNIGNCHATGNVTGAYGVGGLCGGNYSGNITNCYSTGSVSGYQDTGGLCGYNDSGNVSNCYSIGSVSGNTAIGGLCGENYGYINSCYSNGKTTGSYRTGGVCGVNYDTIINCYSISEVTGNERVGGCCGKNYNNISNCYSASIVDGNDFVGGFCGENFTEEGHSTINNCYFLETAGPNNNSGQPLSDGLMKIKSSYTGWDFLDENANGTSSYWAIEPNNYPQLYVFDNNFTQYEFDGNGTESYPYLIYDANDLGAVWQKPDSCYKLVNNINLDGIQWNISVIPWFTGSFNGGNNIIANLIISDSGGLYLGLFGQIQSNSTLKNIGIEDVNISGKGYIGGVCGLNKGSISDCFSTGVITGEMYTGGLSGKNDGGSVHNCYTKGKVTGSYFTGGLCGYNYGMSNPGTTIYDAGITSTISNSYAVCEVIGTPGGYIGGFYGEYTGGLCGGNGENSIIQNCYARGDVSGDWQTGGLCGYNGGYGSITNCYATGNVSGINYSIGGLCGESMGGISRSYFLYNGLDNGLGELLLESQMKEIDSYVDWDFSYSDGDEAEWFMAMEGYPIFSWQISDADIYTDGENNLKDWTVFAGYWMREDCRMYNDFCEFADMDFDGDVDIDDLAELMSYWLEEGIY